MSTCVSLGCKFINYCNQYSLYRDRGDKCEIQDKIINASIKQQAQNAVNNTKSK